MKPFWRSENFGLRLLAFLLACLLWIYVHFLEKGGGTFLTSVSK